VRPFGPEEWGAAGCRAPCLGDADHPNTWTNNLTNKPPQGTGHWTSCGLTFLRARPSEAGGRADARAWVGACPGLQQRGRRRRGAGGGGFLVWMPLAKKPVKYEQCFAAGTVGTWGFAARPARPRKGSGGGHVCTRPVPATSGAPARSRGTRVPSSRKVLGISRIAVRALGGDCRGVWTVRVTLAFCKLGPPRDPRNC
jgi:hypothetical protein